MPYARNLFFTGRGEVLARLHEQLRTGPSAALTQAQAISGLGGIGKTQTAIEYAYRYRDEYQAVLWTAADSREAVMAGFLAIATLLDLPQKEAQDQSIAIAAVKRWLEVNGNWLFIYDNADDPKVLEDFLPLNPKGHILLTSRAQLFDNLGITTSIELEKMSPKEAEDFLYKRTGRHVTDPAEKEAATQLAHELDYLPLALEQAGAYIAAKQARFQDYFSSYRTRGLKLLEQSKPGTGKYLHSVATTWLLNFEQVEQTNTAAADLLRFSAFLHLEAVPLELITRGAPELGLALATALANTESDPLVLDEILEPLTRYSLVRRNLEGQTYDMHRLVQEVIKDGMDEAEQRLRAERVVRAANRAFPVVKFSTWPYCERLLPHAHVCVELIKGWNLDFPEAVRLLNQCGVYLKDRASYGEAEALLRQALILSERVLDSKDPHNADIPYNLGDLYQTQGRYEEAEPLLNKSLVLLRRICGPNHPRVGSALNTLASIYAAQKKYAEAEQLYLQALTLGRQTLGAEHPNIANILNNLGSLYQEQDKNAEAEQCYYQALTILEKTKNVDLSVVVKVLSNLACLYADQGKNKEAEQLYRQALGICRNAFPASYPEMVMIQNNLAHLYGVQGKYTEAEPLFQEMIQIAEKIFGLNDPRVALYYNNFGKLYRIQDRYEDAEPLYQRALALTEKVYYHPHALLILNNYADLLRQTNRKAEAEKLEARAQAIREKQGRKT